MNSCGDQQQQQHKSSKIVSLSRSMVLTQDTSIPSLLILGKLLMVSDAAPETIVSLRAKLVQKWDPSGTVNFWRVTDGAFLVQFLEEADLQRAMNGAPWSCCDGGHLFLMQHVKPEMNLVDQLAGDGFTKADLWVQFHNVPVEYSSRATLVMLAKHIGDLVDFHNLSAAAAPVDLLRAKIRVDITQPLVRSLQVDLDDGRTDLVVSVVYEQIPSLCSSCGIIVAHPAADHCPKGPSPPPLPVAASRLRSRREKEKPGTNVWTRLGSRKLSASTKEVHPLPDIIGKDDSSGRSSGTAGSATTASLPLLGDDVSTAAISSPRSHLEKPTDYVLSRPGSRMGEQQPLLGIDDETHPAGQSSTTAAAGSTSTSEHLPVLGTDGHIVSVNRCLPFNFCKLFSHNKKQELVRDNSANGGANLQHVPSNQRQQKLLLTFSAPHVAHQEPLVMDQKETLPNTSLTLKTPSSIQLDGGYVNYYSCSGSRKNPRIEVEVKTQCSVQLMKKAMEWLTQNTGLKASYDGNKGVINILGLQVDKRMGPVDLVASLYPRTRPKTGVAEAQEKPDSPARFQNMIIRLHDETCCKSKKE